MAEDWTPKDNWSPNNHHHDSKYSKLDHLHDARYSQTSHNHDSVYSKLGHGHDYAPSNHNHDTVYSKLGHVHDYASSNHNHDSVYSKLGHTHSQYVVPGDYVVDQGVTSGVIYRKWNSGLLEQWGHSTATTYATPQKITFAKSYANTTYRITGCFATTKSVGVNDWWNNQAAGRGATLGFGSLASNSCYWVTVWTCDRHQGMELNPGDEIDWYAIGTAAS